MLNLAARARHLCLGVALVSAACGTEAALPVAQSVVEQGPAAPCSINGMLFRDTAETKFTSCGETKLPLRGAVLACVSDAVQNKRSFTLQLKGGALLLPALRPALVGADFGEGFALRFYLASSATAGERSEVKLFSKRDQMSELRIDIPVSPDLTCRMDEENFPALSNTVKAAGPHRRVDATSCTEWFDQRAWIKQPWGSKFVEGERFSCQRAARAETD